jgi:hypothetical protein
LVICSCLTGLGRWGERNNAYVANGAPMDGTWVWELELDNIGDDNGGGGGRPRRLCAEEELVVLYVVLLAMVCHWERG